MLRHPQHRTSASWVGVSAADFGTDPTVPPVTANGTWFGDASPAAKIASSARIGVLPSEGKGQRFESPRARHKINELDLSPSGGVPEVSRQGSEELPNGPSPGAV